MKNKIITHRGTISYCSSSEKNNSNWVKIKNTYYWKIKSTKYKTFFGLISIPYYIKFGVSNMFWETLIRNNIVKGTKEAKPLYNT